MPETGNGQATVYKGLNKNRPGFIQEQIKDTARTIIDAEEYVENYYEEPELESGVDYTHDLPKIGTSHYHVSAQDVIHNLYPEPEVASGVNYDNDLPVADPSDFHTRLTPAG